VSSQTQNIRDLWVAVLARAVLDAARAEEPAPNGAEQAARRRAYNWISDGGADFRQVCQMAGFDPRAIREKLRTGNLPALVKEYQDRFAKEGYTHGQEL
jgi:hypothetical protein